ncbi:MAG: T9SS type A sorting domain-containing protein [Flavobacterium sp.]|nr:T9SS type A sorting domain-containing protein [Flavobacterium sp.]
MIKEKILLLMLLVCMPMVILAQQSVVVTGKDASGSTGSISYSIGQVDYSIASASEGSISQGVQQPYEISVLGVDEIPEITLTMSVYPNPTTSGVNLKIENYSGQHFEYYLFDLTGKLLADKKITETDTYIDMERFEQAVYLLQVMDNNLTVKSFKILRH